MKCFSWLVIMKACRTQEVLPKKGIQLVLTSQMLSLQQNSGNQLISVSSLKGGSKTQKRWWRVIPPRIWWTGIRVQVRSVYIEGRSQPSKGLYFFAYRIRITNNSDRPAQLLRRHWIITDANGKTENVWGIGVIGEQPVVLPNTAFEYSSACPLGTPSGRMSIGVNCSVSGIPYLLGYVAQTRVWEGDFEMKHIDRVGSRTFNVSIAPFSLSKVEDGSDTFSDGS
ncbi:hypothetical protein MTR67_051798 [Solanum verrucosum]|uniref:ApaG domain-containing protein n=1 Tax=Solanum verrucosum TaxID=315347 RepID=A0AAF1A2F5_SOLVR|nr:hypothetical protein MTR67_051798 [Solanum verrucosum]